MLGGGNIVPGIYVVPPLSLSYYGNDYIQIGLDVDISLKVDKSTTYTKSEVDGLLTNKASITYVDNAIAATSTRPTFTTNTLTTSSGSLNITSDIVLFKGLNGITYLNMSPTNISATTNFYIDGVLKIKMEYQWVIK